MQSFKPKNEWFLITEKVLNWPYQEFYYTVFLTYYWHPPAEEVVYVAFLRAKLTLSFDMKLLRKAIIWRTVYVLIEYNEIEFQF